MLKQKTHGSSSRNYQSTLSFIFAGLLAFPLAAGKAHAWTNVLTDNNSSVTIHNDTPDGMNNWLVDGTSQLYQQWFWFRIGSGCDFSLNNIPLISTSQASVNHLVANYASSQLSVQATYTLLGGAAGSGQSAIQEQFTIKNITGSSMGLHFFQYVDYDLSGTWANDNVHLTGSPGDFTGAIQDKNGRVFGEDSLGTPADFGQAGLWPSIINGLQNNTLVSLNDNMVSSNGDLTFAFQWDPTLAPGQSVTFDFEKMISNAITPAPEPSSVALVSTALAATGLWKCRRRFRLFT